MKQKQHQKHRNSRWFSRIFFFVFPIHQNSRWAPKIIGIPDGTPNKNKKTSSGIPTNRQVCQNVGNSDETPTKILKNIEKTSGILTKRQVCQNVGNSDETETKILKKHREFRQNVRSVRTSGIPMKRKPKYCYKSSGIPSKRQVCQNVGNSDETQTKILLKIIGNSSKRQVRQNVGNSDETQTKISLKLRII